MKEQITSQDAESLRREANRRNYFAMLDEVHGWGQGFFVDQPRYRHMHPAWKDERRREEKLRVRMSPEGNSICTVQDPIDADWIASRLNLTARVRQLLADDLPADIFMEQVQALFARS